MVVRSISRKSLTVISFIVIGRTWSISGALLLTGGLPAYARPDGSSASFGEVSP